MGGGVAAAGVHPEPLELCSTTPPVACRCITITIIVIFLGFNLEGNGFDAAFAPLVRRRHLPSQLARLLGGKDLEGVGAPQHCVGVDHVEAEREEAAAL